MNKNDILKNKTICPLAFNHAYVGAVYNRQLCCISEPVKGFSKVPLSEFWNSEEMKQIRLDMINEIPVDACKICYEKEQTEIPSYRQNVVDHELVHGTGREHEHWLTDRVLLDGHAELPTHFDYRTIHCNLTCNHCTPTYSSEHIRLRDKYIKDDDMITSGISFKIDKEFEESMLNDLIDSVDSRRLSRIYFAGGEPMMSPFHWKFIEHLKNIHDKDEDPDFIRNLNIYYNTNLTKSLWKKQNVYEYLSFLNPIIDASIDGVGKTFEYVRKGADWNTVMNNFDSAYNNCKDVHLRRNSFGVQPVILSHNIFSMDEMLSFFEKYEDLNIQPMILMRSKGTEVINGEERYNCHPGYLDPCEFPSEIMLPAIEKAIERVKRCPLSGSQLIIPILENYKLEIDKYRPVCKEFEEWSFARTKMMEKYSSISLNSLLKEINTEAWMWYNSITDKYKNIDMTPYKFFDSLETMNE